MGERRFSRVLSFWSISACLLTLVACSHAAAPLASNETPTPTVASRSASPTATATEFKTYTSAKWGWSIDYPASWFDLANFGAPDTDKYFATENVGAPLAMTNNNGLWLTIRRFAESCQVEYPGDVAERSSIVVDGAHTEYIVREPARNSDDMWSASISLYSGGHCYNIGTLAYSRGVLDRNTQLLQQIYKTFRG